MGDDGKITELRKGTSGWTRLVHDPGTPSGHPRCVAQNGLAWMRAAMSGRELDAAQSGHACMLKGGTPWSATEVSATKLPAGRQDFIRVPPHIMIMNAPLACQWRVTAVPSSAWLPRAFALRFALRPA
jgi:hypothetical protein